MTEHRTQLQVAPDDPCLEGHFPGRPVVPAAAILDRLVAWFEQTSGAEVAGVARARFKAALPPETVWEVVAERTGEDQAKVTCRDRDGVTMTATLRLQERTA